jgi:hypothetical protein
MTRPNLGDIFVTRNAASVGNANPGYWNHVAVLSFWGLVVEAQAEPDAVIAMPLGPFLARYPEWMLLRANLSGEAIAREAAAKVGLPYRKLASLFPRWRRPDIGDNCVSLARKCYAAVSGNDPFWRRPDHVAEDPRLTRVAFHCNHEAWLPPANWYAGMLRQFPCHLLPRNVRP